MGLRFLFRSGTERFRQYVVLASIVALTASRLLCPVPDLIDDSSPSQKVSGEQYAGDAPGQHDPDTCCQLLDDANAIAQPLAIDAVVKAALPSVPAALLVTVSLAAAAGPVIKLIPVSNGPPQRRYQRFMTFWSHAPPR